MKLFALNMKLQPLCDKKNAEFYQSELSKKKKRGSN